MTTTERRQERATKRRAIADQCTVKVGDKIVNRNGYRPRILTINRVTATRLIYGDRDRDWLPRHPMHKPSSPEEIAKAEAELAERRRRDAEAKARQEALEESRLWQLTARISSFNFGDREPWEKLPLHRLEQIVAWIEQATANRP